MIKLITPSTFKTISAGLPLHFSVQKVIAAHDFKNIESFISTAVGVHTRQYLRQFKRNVKDVSHLSFEKDYRHHFRKSYAKRVNPEECIKLLETVVNLQHPLTSTGIANSDDGAVFLCLTALRDTAIQQYVTSELSYIRAPEMIYPAGSTVQDKLFHAADEALKLS